MSSLARLREHDSLAFAGAPLLPGGQCSRRSLMIAQIPRLWLVQPSRISSFGRQALLGDQKSHRLTHPGHGGGGLPDGHPLNRVGPSQTAADDATPVVIRCSCAGANWQTRPPTFRPANQPRPAVEIPGWGRLRRDTAPTGEVHSQLQRADYLLESARRRSWRRASGLHGAARGLKTTLAGPVSTAPLVP